MAILSDSWKYDLLAVLIGVLTALYFYLKRIYSYWDRKGFKTLPGAKFVFGHITGPLTQKEFSGDFIKRLYDSTTEPFIGMYSLFNPGLLVRDTELARNVLIKDFWYFADRNIYCNEEHDPLSGHLFALPVKKWKNIRGKLTPAFSSGKLKAMFSTLVNCGSSLQNFLEKVAESGELLDVHDISARYSINVVASVGFGIETDAIKDPSCEFLQCLNTIFRPGVINAIRWFFFIYAPSLMTFFRMKLAVDEVESFVMRVIKDNLDYREKNKGTRKDFFQLLVQLRNTGSVQLDDEWETVIKGDESEKQLTVNEIAAQSFIFFAAG